MASHISRKTNEMRGTQDQRQGQIYRAAAVAVMYWEPAKYVAKLRTLKTDDNLILLETNMSAGHGGASGRYDYLKEIALDYAFLLQELGSA